MNDYNFFLFANLAQVHAPGLNVKPYDDQFEAIQKFYKAYRESDQYTNPKLGEYEAMEDWLLSNKPTFI